MTDFTLPCCEEEHRVTFHPSGAVIFHNHPGVPSRALSGEFALNPEVYGCFFVAMTIRTGHQDPSKAKIPLWAWRQIESMASKHHARKGVRVGPVGPIDAVPLLDRLALPRHFLVQQAWADLDRARFRTSQVVHRVGVIPVSGPTTVMSGSENTLASAQAKKSDKKLFAKKQQVVVVHLNLKQWARVRIRRAGLVETFFVTRVKKVWSENELHVEALRQSVGYKVLIREAIIRRAHDGIWRVHEWL